MPSLFPLLIVGGGSHASVTAEAACLAGFHPVGFLDDSLDARLSVPGFLPFPSSAPGSPFPSRSLPRLGGLADTHFLRAHPWTLALGSLPARESFLSLLLPDLHANAVTVVHPTAFISPTARLAPGVFVGPRAVIHSRARIEPHAIINSGAIVEHDCHIGFSAHVAPAAALAGSVGVGPYAFIALGSRILPNLRVADHAVVGAGAVVTEDVLPAQTVVGVPARPLRDTHSSLHSNAAAAN